jgi:23S rRNA U2552 (ribose-2'-O)-methylase RlmE/FtsJ
MNKLLEYFNANKNGNAINKYHHYFDIYERHFEKFVGKSVKILEIGVWQGGSTKMWKEYFGKDAKIIGIDINPKCKIIEDEQIKIYIGDQADDNFLKMIISSEGPFDIIMDDGGHYMHQQIASFKGLYLSLNNGGVYLCEDLHTNYWNLYGGGYKKPNTFIELTKTLIDELNAFYSESIELKITEFTKNTIGIHIYDSVVVFDKQNRTKPTYAIIGKNII